MPGFDKTGTRGQGPMAGGRRGRCMPMKQRLGYGRGMGRGMGRGFRRGAEWNGAAPDATELNDLKDQVSDPGEKAASVDVELNGMGDKE